MTSFPTGTVTFLFTDIESSTKLARKYPDAWSMAHARHHALLGIAMKIHQGLIFRINGDEFAGVTQAAVTINQIGLCVIVAAQPGDSTFDAAPPVNQAFFIAGDLFMPFVRK